MAIILVGDTDILILSIISRSFGEKTKMK